MRAHGIRENYAKFADRILSYLLVILLSRSDLEAILTTVNLDRLTNNFNCYFSLLSFV